MARLLCPRAKYVALARVLSHATDAGSVVAFLRSIGDWDEVQAPPAAERGCTAFCPSCHAQFRAGASDCPDCGVAVRAHAAAAAGAAAGLVAGELTS